MKETTSRQTAEMEEGDSKMTTLFDFVEQNQKLITVLGVFTALTVFANNVVLTPFRTILSFFFLTLALLVWLELLLRQRNSKPAHWRLRAFDSLLSMTVLILTGYWLVAYVEHWRFLVVGPLWAAVLYVFSIPIRKFSLYERLVNSGSKRFRILRKLTFISLVVLTVVASGYVSAKVGEPIVNFFLEQKKQIENSGK